MSFQTCPTDVVRAPAERVWRLVSTPRLYRLWADSEAVDASDGSVAPGDRIRLTTGFFGAVSITFAIVSVRPPEELAVDVELPFGLVNHEVIRIGRISDGECRVTFN